MIEEEAVRRFARDLAALAPETQTPVAIAFSGGVDSLALLLLAQAARPGLVSAATVDHRLRPASAAEAAQAGETCRLLGIPHEILPVNVLPAGEGVQAAARSARYRALADWMRRRGIGLLLTGHHADDQAETLVMRLNRGSGVAGLAGIRARSPFPAAGAEAVLARPLLGWRRSELETIVRAAGLQPIEDPSNRDEAYDRVRLRAQLAQAPWLDAAAVARSAAALADAEEALTATAASLFDQRVRRDGEALLLDPSGLPRELRRRLAVAALVAAGGGDARGEQVTALVAGLQEGRVQTLGGVKCSGGERWRFEAAPARRTG